MSLNSAELSLMSKIIVPSLIEVLCLVANKSLTIYVMRKSTNQNKLLIEYLASIKTNHK